MIVTQSPKLKQLIRFARKAAASEAPILLSGESGTGKELFAQLIHQASRRQAAALVSVNCAALPENLIESELFGHEKGAFSGAITTRVGRFERADGGTLLLDEVSEIPIASQAKLLRVLESKQFERVGNSIPLHHDVRIVAASNRSLQSEIDAGRFRLDLYHRLNVIEIKIPPLRERSGDIPLLAMHFVEHFREQSEIALEGFEAEAMRALARHQWPGNVRELRNVVHRACVVAETPLIRVGDLGLPAAATAPPRPADSLPEHWLHMHLEEIERLIITTAIERFGNRRLVAQKLGVSERTLTNKMKRYRAAEAPPKAA
jgi:transcriptional regulator with PAS, ATPase and Fis domain